MKNIYLLGFMGSGKSFYGKHLSKKFNLNYLDLDEFIENTLNLSINQFCMVINKFSFR